MICILGHGRQLMSIRDSVIAIFANCTIQWRDSSEQIGFMYDTLYTIAEQDLLTNSIDHQRRTDYLHGKFRGKVLTMFHVLLQHDRLRSSSSTGQELRTSC